MPLQSFLVWVQRSLAWSNSRQSWEERLGLLSLLLGGLLIWWFSGQISLLQQVSLWAALILLAAILLRRGWLKLFGPMLFYDLIRMSRRNRFIWMRMVYVGFLLFFLFVAASNTYSYGLTPTQAASRVAMNYFQAFMGVQLMAVFLLTPAYVAGSIAEEKEKKTLEFILATDLRNREIVLSKLVSRLCNLTLFILTGLPILSLMQLLGGVDPNLVLAGFAATALTALGMAGVSIFNSVQCKRARDAIALTYLETFAYIALSLMAFFWQMRGGASVLGFPLWLADVPLLGWTWWFGTPPPTVYDLISAFNSGNLLIGMGKVTEAAYRGTLATELPTLLQGYSLFNGLIFVVSVSWAVLRLRSVAISQMSESKLVEKALAKQAAEAVAGVVLPTRQPLLSRPPIGNYPMLWKELYAEGNVRFHWIGWIMVLCLVVLTFVPAVWIFYDYLNTTGGGARWGGHDWLQEAMNAWVRFCNAIIGSLTLIAVAIRSAGAISSEREKQTWDSLLTSPVDSDEILTAKWLGAIASVRLSWVWMGSVWLVGVMTSGLHPLALPVLVAAWLVYAAAVSLIGLHFSIKCNTSGRATVYTLLTLAGLSFGHLLPWMCCMGFSSGPGRALELIGQFQVGLTPPFALGFLPFWAGDFRYHDFDGPQRIILFCLVGLFIWTLACIVLWISTSLHFRTVTHRDKYLRADVGFGPALGQRGRWEREDRARGQEE